MTLFNDELSFIQAENYKVFPTSVVGILEEMIDEEYSEWLYTNDITGSSLNTKFDTYLEMFWDQKYGVNWDGSLGTNSYLMQTEYDGMEIID